MLLSEFMENIDSLTFVDIGRLTYFPETRELFNPFTGGSRFFGSHEEMLDAKVDEMTAREIIEDESYRMLLDFDGGRGSSSDSSGTFKFDHASGGGDDDSLRATKFPAEFNDGDKFQSETKALDKFRERHATSDHEYAIAVDGEALERGRHELGRAECAGPGAAHLLGPEIAAVEDLQRRQEFILEIGLTAADAGERRCRLHHVAIAHLGRVV